MIVNNKDGEKMYLAIFIFILVTLLLATNINLNIKSSKDTIKIDVKLGLIRFAIPHQRLIQKLIDNQKNKNMIQQREDFVKFISGRHYLNRLFKHSSLAMFYMAKYTKEDIYLNPIINGVYLITSNQIKAYLANHFKKIDVSNVKLIVDENYDNIDYFICVNTDFISLLTAIFIKD